MLQKAVCITFFGAIQQHQLTTGCFGTIQLKFREFLTLLILLILQDLIKGFSKPVMTLMCDLNFAEYLNILSVAKSLSRVFHGWINDRRHIF